MDLTLRLLLSLYNKESEGSVCDCDLSMCPKYKARTLEELSWESIGQTEDLKRRGSRRGSFGAQSVGDTSRSVLWCFNCNIYFHALESSS